jgi:hypothetical protein
MQFVTKTRSVIDLQIIYKNKKIAYSCSSKFLGLILDNTFSWKNHIDTIIPKLSSTCFAVRAIKPFLSQESLKMVYFSYFHSIMTYGLVFWGSSYHNNTIFKLQKRIIRLMMGSRNRESCREYFRKLKLLPLQTQYIYVLLLFVINIKQHFEVNSEIHNINTRNNLALHYPLSHLSVYQKSIHYTGIKVFSGLPVPIKQLSHYTQQFKMALNSFLHLHSFNSLD